MQARARVFPAFLLIGCLLPPMARAGDLWIQNARLIDGTGALPRSNVSILIEDGRISAIGENTAPSETPQLDAQGHTVLPGLIDAHVHLSMVPGSGQREDPEALSEELHRQHLRAYLACGVTTVLDTGITIEAGLRIRDWLAAGAPGPRVLMLAPFLAPPGGYGTRPEGRFVFPSAATPEEVKARLDESADLPSAGVKVPIEFGFGPTKIWPIHPPEMREAIVRMAGERGLPVYVHGFSEEEQSIGLDMGAHALVHAGFSERAPSNEFVDRLAATNTYVITTLAIYDSLLVPYHPERLEEPLVRLTVPEVELATARDPESGRFLARTAMGFFLPPWVPEFLHGLAARLLWTEDRTRGSLGNMQQAVKRFRDAGVPIVAGSDSGNWPILPYEFHGPTTLREIELLGEAGLSPQEAIQAATRVAAEMLGLAEEIGTVEVGKRADLVIVREDPLDDLRALRTVRYTVVDGEARTPEAWMSR
jgi:imidazolonepropionase-like amidohydrolase